MKRDQNCPELCEIDHLYTLLYFGIKNTPLLSQETTNALELTTIMWQTTWH